MGEGFCWKCARYVEKLLIEGTIGGVYPWDHCHHEPKENTKCWCENYSVEKFGKYAEVYGKILPLIFCPQCGRKF